MSRVNAPIVPFAVTSAWVMMPVSGRSLAAPTVLCLYGSSQAL
jgi:hypothetical protein